MSNCIINPTIKTSEEKEVESKLFRDLFKLTKDRNLTIQIWGLTRVPGFLKNVNLEKDENGEITLEALQKAINLNELLDRQQLLNLDMRTSGLVDSTNSPIVFKNANKILQKVNDFNDSHTDNVVNVLSVEGGYIASLENKSKRNSNTPNTLKFKYHLNNRLLSILNRIGYDVSFVNDDNISGVFNPLNAKENADGLKEIIQLNKGEIGESAFAEEFCHVIVEGLKNTQLGLRFLNLFNNTDLIREMLGDLYKPYYDKYNGNIEYLKREAAAKLLAEYVKGNTDHALVKRFWEYSKVLMSKTSVEEIDKAIAEAQEVIDETLAIIESDELKNIISHSAIMSSPILYELRERANKLQTMANDSLTLMKKKLKILSLRHSEGEYDENLLEVLKEAQKNYDDAKYVSTCSKFLQEAIESLTLIQEGLKTYVGNPAKLTKMQEIKEVSKNVRALKEFSEAYTPTVKDFLNIQYFIDSGELEINEKDALELKTLAIKLNEVITSNDYIYNELRYKVVYDFLKLYWGEDKMQNIGKNKGAQLTLDGMLRLVDKDINIFDKYISSMGDASDPLLSLIHKVVKDTKDDRNEELNTLYSEIQSLHKSLIDAGYTTDFMYEKDDKGIPTGRLISDWNWVAFEEDKQKHFDSLDKDLHAYEKHLLMEKWELENMEPLLTDEELQRGEMVPSRNNSRWYNPNRIESLPKAQKDYYNRMMELKHMLDSKLPARYVGAFKAIQVRNDIVQAVDITKPIEATRMVLSNIKDNFVKREDDVEYGESGFEDTGGILSFLKEPGVKAEMLDMQGNPIKKIPVYFTAEIKDKRRLNTDFTASILAYADMALNYDHMSNIVDALELVRNLVYDRQIQQVRGDNKLIETFTVLGEKITKKVTKRGEGSNIAERLDDFYASSLYGQKKIDHGSIEMFGQEVDIAKLSDSVKSYSSLVRLGLNLFSGISNVTMGNTQMLIEAAGKEFFTVKDLLHATKDYNLLLPKLLAECNSTKKTNLLDLLINKFDALEDFNTRLQNEGYYKSWFGRILGNSNMFFLNHMGEHLLHSKTMLAVLRNTKVKLGNDTISLFEAFETKDFGKKGVKLVLKKGVKDLDGNLLSSNDSNLSEEAKAEIDKRFKEFLAPIKRKIRRANQIMHGAYGEDELGAINRNALGRLAMQFRQWMPTHYYRRFARASYDAQTENWREGYYITYGRFIKNLYADVIRGDKTYKLLKGELSESEKANIRKARTEIGIFVMLTLLIRLFGTTDDKKGKWGQRMALYQLKRLELETGASIPWLSIIENFFTIAKSPVPSTDSFEGLIDLLKFWNIFDEIESGPYQGWSEYARDAFRATPVLPQIKRVIDVANEDYLFNIYNK